MNFKKIILMLVILAFSFSLLGCINQVEELNPEDIFVDENNNDLNVVNTSMVGNNVVAPIQKVGEEPNFVMPVTASSVIDCENSLDCLINAVKDNKEAKAIIESVYRISNKDFVNKDYLEVKTSEQGVSLYRIILVENFEVDGSCYFTKEQLLNFLPNWNVQSFETNYYEDFNCKGRIYDKDEEVEIE